MKTLIHSTFLIALLFLFFASCSQNKGSKKSVEVNSRSNQTSSSGNNNAPNSVDASSDAPIVSNIEKETVNVVKSGTKNELPKNWPWRGINFQSENSDASDVAYLASIGVDFLRIQMKPAIRSRRKKLDPTKCFYDELYWADSILTECKKYGMTSVIAFNHLVLDPKINITEKSQEFWDERKYIDSTLNMITIIANKFKTRGDELSAYEVMGEPVIRKGQQENGKTPPQLEKFFKDVLQTIRKVDSERWFLLTPGPWGKPTNFNGFAGFNIKDNRIIYNAHMYLPDQFTHQGIHNRPRGVQYPGKIKGEFWDRKMLEEKLSQLKKFQVKQNCLVYMGEFQATRWSKGADIWVKDVIELMDAYQWSWSLFAFEAGTVCWDPYYDVVNKNIPIADWEIQYVGPTTPHWKYMLTEYAKNKK
ncbi:MAG: cellulase family glycosylhydrolase [Bacteroidetes bacterium]|nr:cellulase family glycosylhydrolase [Bacteroidota bacterium]